MIGNAGLIGEIKIRFQLEPTLYDSLISVLLMFIFLAVGYLLGRKNSEK